MGDPVTSPAYDPIAVLRAAMAEQIAKEGGHATLQGRELMLSYGMQEWLAKEIYAGTDPADAVNALLFAATSNLVIAAKNLGTITGEAPEEIFEKFEDAMHHNARQLLSADLPVLTPPITPAIKQ